MLGEKHFRARKKIRRRVIDGDTIRIYQRQPNVRLVGFNAPETRKPDCEAEREIGGRATRFLRDLIRASDLDFEYVGKVGVGACAWGRDCGTLKANGRDVGDLLIAARLAVPFICPGGRCPPTPRPWCTAVAPIPSPALPRPNNPVVQEIWPNPVVREIWPNPET
jgi:endonuclease YncB( thermonuclease family)